MTLWKRSIIKEFAIFPLWLVVTLIILFLVFNNIPVIEEYFFLYVAIVLGIFISSYYTMEYFLPPKFKEKGLRCPKCKKRLIGYTKVKFLGFDYVFPTNFQISKKCGVCGYDLDKE